MTDAIQPDAESFIRMAAAKLEITFSEVEIAAGAAQLEAVLDALAAFDDLGTQELEPTTFLRFEPSERST